MSMAVILGIGLLLLLGDNHGKGTFNRPHSSTGSYPTKERLWMQYAYFTSISYSSPEALKEQKKRGRRGFSWVVRARHWASSSICSSLILTTNPRIRKYLHWTNVKTDLDQSHTITAIVLEFYSDLCRLKKKIFLDCGYFQKMIHRPLILMQ